MQDLLEDIEFNFDDRLGSPLPDSPHAVSVSMPKWLDVIDYEEGTRRVIRKLKSGYPRFFFHPYVQKLFDLCDEKFSNRRQFTMALPSEKSCQWCADFLSQFTDKEISINDFGSYGIFCITADISVKPKAKEFWQHSGLVISSRLALDILNNKKKRRGTYIKDTIKSDLSDLYQQDDEDIYLLTSGITGTFYAHKSLAFLRPGKKTMQIGFPYVDSLKIQEKFGPGVDFIDYSSTKDFKAIENILAKGETGAIFCEIPTNPLLISIDLENLKQLADKYDVPIIIDDTVATGFNLDIKPYADVITSSLTKFYSGVGDVMAGCLIINNTSKFHDDFKFSIDNLFEDLLYPEDAVILEHNSIDFRERMAKINENTEILCDAIIDHPAIDKIYYPAYINNNSYNSLKRPHGGYGGLFSFTLKHPQDSVFVYDRLTIHKGPSLGTNFTIACPYTLLAHYNELDFAEECGILPYLVRVSVGLEDVYETIQSFNDALDSVI